MLKITSLSVVINNKEILKNISLDIKRGETHAIMGPNGIGKSTLAHVICGKYDYKVTNGSIKFLSKTINNLDIVSRARMGIFMSHQHPVEIPGVSWNSFIKVSVNSIRKSQGMEELDSNSLIKLINKLTLALNIDINLLSRDVNDGFSGGEKKKFEILQMILLDPCLIILDEIDSGLDVDALKLISSSINHFRNSTRSFLIITHYNRILNYIVPDFVHIFSYNGVIKTGNKNLAKNIEVLGYNSIN